MIRKAVIVFFSILLLGLTSCGTTYIIADYPAAEIFVDSTYIGKGTATITRAGVPKKAMVDAVYNGKVLTSVQIRRRFDGVTLLAGLFTNYLGFIFCWRYPKEINVHVPRTFLDEAGQSVWEQAPGTYRPGQYK